MDDFEILRIVNFISSKNMIYNYKLTQETVIPNRIYERDPIFDEAVKLISKKHFCTPAMLQKGFAVGYHRSCNILMQMEVMGVVGTETNTGKRPVLLKKA